LVAAAVLKAVSSQEQFR